MLRACDRILELPLQPQTKRQVELAVVSPDNFHSNHGVQTGKECGWYGLTTSSSSRDHIDTDNVITGAAKLRPTLSMRTLPCLSTPLTSIRHQSNVPAEDPKKKAQSIVDALPGNSLASKTAILSAGAGISIWAISNELYVVNEESVVAFCLLSVFYGIFKYGGPGYTEWANSQVGKIKDLLNEARTNHAASVKERIEDVKPLSNVVDITKQLFAVSKVGINGYSL
jgi:hypothetical protein